MILLKDILVLEHLVILCERNEINYKISFFQHAHVSKSCENENNIQEH